MISKCANVVTNLCIQKMVIEGTEKEVYQYGFELIISTAVNFFWVLIVGLVSGRTLFALFGFLIFAWIRTQSGGYHASSYFKCNFSLIIVFGFIMASVRFFKITDFNFAFFVLAYIYIPLFMWQFSPVENMESPLSIAQFALAKQKVLTRVLISEAVGISGWVFGYTELAVLILFVHVAVIILIVIEKLKRRRLNEIQY